MARKSAGDKKLEAIIENAHNNIEHYEAINKEKFVEIENNKVMISVLREQLESIKEMCGAFDDKEAKNYKETGEEG